LGKPVFILDIHNPDSFQNKITTGIGTVGYKYDSAFASFAKVRFIPLQRDIHVSRQAESFEITVLPQLPPLYYSYISTHPSLKTTIVTGVFNKNGWIMDLPLNYSLYEMTRGPKSLHYNIQLPRGKYYLIFSIFHIGTITATHNSEKIKLTIE